MNGVVNKKSHSNGGIFYYYFFLRPAWYSWQYFWPTSEYIVLQSIVLINSHHFLIDHSQVMVFLIVSCNLFCWLIQKSRHSLSGRDLQSVARIPSSHWVFCISIIFCTPGLFDISALEVILDQEDPEYETHEEIPQEYITQVWETGIRSTLSPELSEQDTIANKQMRIMKYWFILNNYWQVTCFSLVSE